MKFSFYKLLWILLHLVVDLCEAIYFFGLEFRENFINFMKSMITERRFQGAEDVQLIEQHISHLKKLPKHLAVIVKAEDKRDVDLRKLTNLVLWSMNSGVNFISFYDYKGKDDFVIQKRKIIHHFMSTTRILSGFPMVF